MGFLINSYETCVANKYINRKQCTIDWYVDYNKVSHVEHDIIDDIISKAEERFLVLTTTKGNIYTFLVIKKGTSRIGGYKSM